MVPLQCVTKWFVRVASTYNVGVARPLQTVGNPKFESPALCPLAPLRVQWDLLFHGGHFPR